MSCKIRKTLNRTLSVLAAALLASANLLVMEPAFAEVTDLCHMSFELHPDRENLDRVVTLEGLVPSGASARATDVTEDYNGVAAYDISIRSGWREYQPNSDYPIYVEIVDPAIYRSAAVSLWHITDDGRREQVHNITVEDGKVGFYATGFSVYEVVTNVMDTPALFDMVAARGAEGYDVYFVASGKLNAATNPDRGGPYYLQNLIIDSGNPAGRPGIQNSSNIANASKLYFERPEGSDNQFYIYFQDDDGTRHYAEMFTGSFGNVARTAIRFADPEENKTLFTLEKHPDTNQFRIYYTINNKKYFWIRDKSGTNAVVGYNPKDVDVPEGDKGTVWMSIEELADDFYEFDGKTFPLIYQTDSNAGVGLMANNDKHFAQLYKLIARENNSSSTRTLYVSDAEDITEWTFHSAGMDKYQLSAVVSGVTLYLKNNNGTLALTDDPSDESTKFAMKPGTHGTFRLASGSSYLTYDETNGFGIGSDGVPLNCARKSNLTDNENVVYTASRISVSDTEKAKDGADLIVYTRLWNEKTRKYEFYLLGPEGNLVPCQASGDKLMWLDNATSKMLWHFTVYTYDDETPNGYYELQNTYSGKYIGPQIRNGQLLSDSTVGILLQGREAGEYYSDILAWDGYYMDYAALKGELEYDNTTTPATKVVTLSSDVMAESTSFYFAILDDLDTEELHPVETLDNDEYGIVMKMINFEKVNGLATDAASPITQYYFNGDSSDAEHLLSTGLGNDGYPTILSSGVSFKNAFDSGSQEYVNNLFVKSVHDATGYFEYDSCQNFASLVGGSEYKYTYKDENGNSHTVDGGRNFTVYRELGTMKKNIHSSSTSQHGQFLPYNTISPGYIVDGKLNKYGYDARRYDESLGELDESDPRKYEVLYDVDPPDYYFGMELAAKFIQTPSGLDAWGHDIIFEFTGDDDFWLYVDGELVIDLSGVHSAQEGRVNFRTGEVVYDRNDRNNNGGAIRTTLYQLFRQHYLERGDTPEQADAKLRDIFTQKDGNWVFKEYSEHTMRIFFMERGAGASNLCMRFNLASVRKGDVLLSKSLSGDPNDLADIDYKLVQFPFQVLYNTSNTTEKPADDDPNWVVLNPSDHTQNPDGKFGCTYQSSTQPVKFEERYVLPGSGTEPDTVIEDVFFLNPGKAVEISFPDDAIWYKIVECAVNSEVYADVKVNGTAVTGTPIAEGSLIKKYSTDASTVSDRLAVSFENPVNEGNFRTLKITKQLYDEHYDKNATDNSAHMLYYDSADPTKVDKTRFKFRLYLSNGIGDELEPAYFKKYYVSDPGNRLCYWDEAAQDYVIYTDADNPNGILAKHDNIKNLTTAQRDALAFHTSPNGAIDHIPAGYSVEVPGLPAGTYFWVDERDYEIPLGYDLVGFENVMADESSNPPTSSYLTQTEYHLAGSAVQNVADMGRKIDMTNSVGLIRAGHTPNVRVKNKRGFGLKATKAWNDKDYVTEHPDIWVAVYAGDELLRDTVQKIAYPANSVQSFFEGLLPGKELANYQYYEIEGVVTDSEGRLLDSCTPVRKENGAAVLSDTYVVNYQLGEPVYPSPDDQENTVPNARTDTILNKRKGGLVINLYQWSTTTANDDTPLQGGEFELYCGSKKLGPFVSDAGGNVTIVYDLQEDTDYTLKQTKAPAGYLGMKQPITFRVNTVNGILTETWVNPNDTDDDTDRSDLKYWAEYENRAVSADNTERIVAEIDIYNKPYELIAQKKDRSSGTLVNGAKFSLHREVSGVSGPMIDYTPLPGYEELISGSGTAAGVIPRIDRTLAPNVYYLAEDVPSSGYQISEDGGNFFRFEITDLDGPVLHSGGLEATMHTEQNADASLVTYTVSILNERAVTDYYFDIEKLALVDRNVRSGDPEQKFIFRVERFDEEDVQLRHPKECFYVTLSCTEELAAYPYLLPDQPDDLPETGHESYADGRVTKTYTEDGETKQYTYPAAVYRGKQTVRVQQKGIYRISEVQQWSQTDYDFWQGSNRYFYGKGNAVRQQQTDGCVAFSVEAVRADLYASPTYTEDGTETHRPLVSFTNSESEFAYLSAQAYAENIIQRISD